jgi:nitrile hydratase subunit beta
MAVDGIHDLGGMVGFGPIEVERDEPVFHEPWHGRVFAMSASSMMAGIYGSPSFRHAIERMDPAHYLGSGYYEHWLTGVATLLVEAGVVDGDDLVRRAGSFPLSRSIHPDPLVFDGPPQDRFAVDDLVRVSEQHPTGHTRCPDYVRGRVGRVVRVDAPSNVPDVEAHRGLRWPEVTCSVRFTCRELWGSDASERDSVTVDLYDRYLEPT